MLLIVAVDAVDVGRVLTVYEKDSHGVMGAGVLQESILWSRKSI